MATVFDVAEYILRKNGPCTTMKLQKLAYYSQAWSLAWDDVPLFEDDFQAWANGPVCVELFSEHKGHFNVDEGFFKTNWKLSKDEKSVVDSVIEYYGDKSPQWLSDLTHMERPWKETRGDLPPGASCNRVIPKELMQEYYAGL